MALGLISLEARAQKPIRMALDIGAGYNLINRRVLPDEYEAFEAWDGDIPQLCDANRKRLRFRMAVLMKVRSENAIYTARLIGAERLAFEVLLRRDRSAESRRSVESQNH